MMCCNVLCPHTLLCCIVAGFYNERMNCPKGPCLLLHLTPDVVHNTARVEGKE